MFSIISKGQDKRKINHFYKKLAENANPSSSFCKTFEPELFKSLRKKWGITEIEFRKELAKVKGGKTGAGKSKMLMWTSKKNRFFIKTMPHSEIKTFLSLLKKYYKFMLKNKNSLLPKFMGIYMEHGTYFLVQNNLQYGLEKNNSWVYDIKGSHRHRTSELKKRGFVGKDNNFGSSTIYFPKSKRILTQIKKDTQFLNSHKLMDYSLLVILNTNTKQCKKQIYQYKGPEPSPKINTCIHIGIIDILQKYNMKKRIERIFKTKRIFNIFNSEVSALDSKNYKIRFDRLCHSVIKSI